MLCYLAIPFMEKNLSELWSKIRFVTGHAASGPNVDMRLLCHRSHPWPNRSKWYSTLKAAGTWETVNPPEGANLVSSKWVFKAKKDAAGVVI